MIRHMTFMMALPVAFLILARSAAVACDVAVISGRVTADGKPALWKNRDCSASWHEEIQYFPAKNEQIGGCVIVFNFDDFTNLNTGSSLNPSGGLNEAGFAISCTSVYEEFNPLHEAFNINTHLIRHALEECATIRDFERLLRWFHLRHLGKVISGNFVVLDAHGGAALYECYTGILLGGIRQIMYLKYDADTGRVSNEWGITLKRGRPDFIGFHNRANSNTFLPWNLGEERRHRATAILNGLAASGRLEYRTLMRELSRDVNCTQPGGSDETNYDTDNCISRAQTRLGMVVRGVRDGGDPRLATFWCALGEPAVSVYTPYFPCAREVTPLAWVDGIDMDGQLYNFNDTCLLNRIFNRREIFERRLYATNNGYALGMDDPTINKKELVRVQAWAFPLEDVVLEKTAELLLDLEANPWRDLPAELGALSRHAAAVVYDHFAGDDPRVPQWDLDGRPYE